MRVAQQSIMKRICALTCIVYLISNTLGVSTAYAMAYAPQPPTQQHHLVRRSVPDAMCSFDEEMLPEELRSKESQAKASVRKIKNAIRESVESDVDFSTHYFTNNRLDDIFPDMLSPGAEAVKGVSSAMEAFQNAAATEALFLDIIRGADKETIITDSVTLGSSVALPVLQQIIVEVMGDSVGELSGGALGILLALGMNIYSGVKVDEAYDKIRQQDKKVAAMYAKHIDIMKTALQRLEHIAKGNAKSVIYLDIDFAGKFLLSVHQKTIERLYFSMAQHAIATKSKMLAQKIGSISTPYAIVDNNKTAQQQVHVGNMPSAAPWKNAKAVANKHVPVYLAHELNAAFATIFSGSYVDEFMENNQFVFFVNKILKQQEKVNYGTAYSTTKYLKSTPLYDEFYGPLFDWYYPATFSIGYSDVLIQSVQAIMHHNKHALIHDLITELRAQNNNPEFSHTVAKIHNRAVTEVLGWLLLGKKMLAALENDKEVKGINGLSWTLKILTPVLGGLVSGVIDQNEIARYYSAEQEVVKLIAYLVNQKIDINDHVSVHGAVQATYAELQHAHFTQAEDKVNELFNHYLAEVKNDIQPMLIDQNAVVPLHINFTQATKILTDNTGIIADKFDDAIQTHLKRMLELEAGASLGIRQVSSLRANVLQNLSFLHHGYTIGIAKLLASFTALSNKSHVTIDEALVKLFDIKAQIGIMKTTVMRRGYTSTPNLPLDILPNKVRTFLTLRRDEQMVYKETPEFGLASVPIALQQTDSLLEVINGMIAYVQAKRALVYIDRLVNVGDPVSTVHSTPNHISSDRISDIIRTQYVAY